MKRRNDFMQKYSKKMCKKIEKKKENNKKVNACKANLIFISKRRALPKE